jgi:bifunctional UDP-N-acetylglucosamine pyrophosphorylase/glucosamine-1-phosphate N-acetyltransferase
LAGEISAGGFMMDKNKAGAEAQGLAAVILAAGLGTRMKSAMPKVLHELAGRPLLGHVLAALEPLSPARLVVVVGPEMDGVAKAFPQAEVMVQEQRLGTAHAVLAAEPALRGHHGQLVVLFGDTPLIETDTLDMMLTRQSARGGLVVLGFHAKIPGGYGRLVTEGEKVLRIVEARDAAASQKAITLCNSGVLAGDCQILLRLLAKVGNRNAKGEYYLTDVVALGAEDGIATSYIACAEDEVLGVNSRADLALAEAAMQRRLREQAMAQGATLVAPETVFFSYDTRLGEDVVVEPHVVFGPGVRVADRVTIKAYSHLEGTHIMSGARIGPYARLRPGAEIGRNVHIGNFVEVKKAAIESGAKVNHLTYIGDARVGAGANVGAGTITCNYDGYDKYFTDIGENAFIGSNSALVAPVKIGAGAIIGAGSVITSEVAADALALTRAPQTEKKGWAKRFHDVKQALKAKLKKAV